MAVLYTPHFQQFFDDAGEPLSGGLLYTYSAGTTTPKATYTTAAGTIEHTNPIVLDSAGRAIIFLSGSYKFVLHDADNVPVNNGTTDNVTSFNAISETGTGFFQTFSGDASTTTFTLSDNLGTDENSLMVFAQYEYTKNGTFATDTDWTKGTGWSIGSGVATATGAISTALEQTAAFTIIQGKAYEVRYTVTRSAGSVTPNVGGTAGTARSASGTYSEIIICGSTQTISFTTSGFTGTLDNVSVRELGGLQIFPPTSYTVNGTSLIFSGNGPASGTNNILVYAPYTLIEAAGAAQVAADAALASAAAALASETNAAASEAAIDAAIDQISDMTVDSFTGDGSTTTFDLSITPASEANTWVFVDGVYIPKSDYSISTDDVVFAVAPTNLAEIEVITGVPFGAATTASSVSVSTAGLDIITETNAQGALGELDAAVKQNQDDIAAIGTVLIAPVTASSGTTVTVSGIPSGAKHVVLFMNGVSSTSTDNFLFRPNNQTSGYTGSCIRVVNGTKLGNSTSYALSASGMTGGSAVQAVIKMYLANSSTNLWQIESSLTTSDAGSDYNNIGNGSVTLSAELSSVTFLFSSSANFDGVGTISGMYFK